MRLDELLKRELGEKLYGLVENSRWELTDTEGFKITLDVDRDADLTLEEWRAFCQRLSSARITANNFVFGVPQGARDVT